MLKDNQQKISTEDPRYLRDTYSKALLATDRTALLQHRAMRAKSQEQSSVINTMNSEINALKKDLDDIKELLTQIAKGVNINGC